MGVYGWCDNCKKVTKFAFYDGAFEHNPVYVCNECDTEQEEIDEEIGSEIEDLKDKQEEMTTSDLQGCVMVLSKRYKINEEDILNYVYNGE